VPTRAGIILSVSSADGRPSPPDIAAAPLIEAGDGFLMTWALHVAATLHLADHIAEGKFGTDELARATATDEVALYRVLRYLQTMGVVAEGPPRRFQLTQRGKCLRSDVPDSLRAWFAINGPIARVFFEDPLASLRTGRPAFETVFGTDFFGFAAVNPEWGREFDTAMTEMTRETAIAVATAYGFDGLRRIVDVGGGRGILLATLLTEHPEMRGVLVDLPHVVADAHGALKQAGLHDRCEVVAGDFFDAVPEGGDAYVLSWILHDWDDERATTILANCRRAMRDDSRLLLVEVILPANGSVGYDFATSLDLVMLVTLGGRERTATEYERLLASAGLVLTKVVPTTSPMSVIEAIPAA
jgi:predicted O-methyltransferase YrrM